MNWIDLVIIAALIFFAFEAWGSPFISELLDLASFLLALILSFRFYNAAATFFENQFSLPHGLSLVMGFIGVWFLAEAIFYVLVKLIIKIRPISFLSNRHISIIPAILRGILFISLILVVLATFPIQPAVKRSIQESKIGSVLLKNAYKLEEPVKNVFGGVAEDTLTFLTIKPKTNESVDLGFQAAKFEIDPDSETKMIDLVNQERVARGLSPTGFDSRLREIARGHSEDMLRRGYFAHYSPEGETVADRADKKGISYLVIGENLAFAPTLDLAHKGLMNSEGHRANILSPEFGKIGIGVIDGGVYGKMFTQVFTN